MKENEKVEKNNSKENEVKNKMSKKNKTIIIVGVVIIALLLAGGILAEMFLRKPNNIFEQSIANVFDKVEKTVDKYITENVNLEEKDFSLKGDLSFNTTQNLGEYEDLKEYLIDLNMDFSLNKEILKMNIGIKEKNNSFLTANIFAQDGKIYGKIPELLSKTILLDNFDFDDFKMEQTSITKNDLKALISGTKKMMISTIDKSKLKETKNVDALGKTNLKEISYLLDENNQKATLEKIIGYIKNNQDYKDILEKVLNEDIDTIIEDLEFELEYYDYDADFTINVYTEGMLNQVVGIVLKDVSGSITIANNKIELDSKRNKLSIEENEKGFILNVDTDDFKGKLNITCHENNNEKMSSTIELTFESNKETYNIKLNLEMTTNINVEKENVSGSVKLEELTVEEAQEMYTKFFEKLEGTPFETIITEMFYSFV